ncbi:NAD-dependent epimerase/dehydratase family protein [Hymenobacter cheonanensis]|uniref:NAD-dependent epimerase/dehydratase family protein n=1 Tax=Hymenobacter sp. CA2-7 TaxID=3063993 RepID=UPI00271281C5|nr:NAD(P)-dependent oxidoreductase [Hymenobacter sp. CA2-7]MDO7884407.1 NAD(P)-dependent oxidoreductase [Hymenobacter sp. CA2-7]
MSAGRVVLTGATGFIGSYLAEELVAKGYEVLALRRTQSSLWRVASVAGHITWVTIDEPDWQQQVVAWQAEYLVHAAWLGVGVGQRDDWNSQLSNLTFTMELLQTLLPGGLKKVVVLGSQAEYGAFHGRVDEGQPTQPVMAYGAVKLATLELVRAYCSAQSLEWYWLRVFAVFGPREDAHWFVSFVAANFLKYQSPALTNCEQQYDYLFAPDLARAIVQTLPAAPGFSGVYNVGANRAISLRTMVDTIRDLTGTATSVQYGALPYRPGQVMHMESSTSRFEHTFGPITQTALPTALAATVEYVKQHQ